MSKTNRIFIGNIIDKINAGSLNSAFEEFGEITEIHINKDDNFAFIGFETTESAESAVEETNGTEIFGGLLNVSLMFHKDNSPPDTFSRKQTSHHGNDESTELDQDASVQSSRIFVGNFSREVTKDEMNAIFSGYGEIKEIWIPFSFKGYCFVEYETSDSAQLAVDGMSGTEHAFSAKLKVEMTARKRKPENKSFSRGEAAGGPNKWSGRSPSANSPRLFIGGIKDEVDKATFRPVFEPFGPITHVWIAFNPPGFAFVEYEDVASARRAISALNGQTYFGGKLKVDFTESKDTGREKYGSSGRSHPYDMPGRGRGRGRGRGAPRGSRRPPPFRSLSSRGSRRPFGRSLLPRRAPPRQEAESSYYDGSYYEGSYEPAEGHEDPYTEEGTTDSYSEDQSYADPYYKPDPLNMRSAPTVTRGRGRGGARGRGKPPLAEDYY